MLVFCASVTSDGTTSTLTSGSLTLTTAPPPTAPTNAAIASVPTPTAVARPLVEIVATDGSGATQAATAVRSAVEPSEYCPMAANCCVCPTRIETVSGTTVMLMSRGTTVNVAWPDVDSNVAEIVVVSGTPAVARPDGEIAPT